MLLKLNDADLIRFTKISEDIKLEGYDLILEHQKFEPVTFSNEWSFEMVKAAAKTIIEVNRILLNMDMKRKTHIIIILYSMGMHPNLLTLGIFHRRKNEHYWECKDEYYRIFVYTLKIWSSGSSDLARKSISDVAGFFEQHEYLLYRNPMLRIFPVRIITKVSYFVSLA